MIFGPSIKKHPKIEQIENYLKEITDHEGKIKSIRDRINVLLIELDKEIKEMEQKKNG